MPTVTITLDGPRIGEDTADLIYLVTDTTDASAAEAAAFAVAPATYGTLVRRDPTVEPDGYDIWRVTIPYRKREKQETGGSSYSFDTGGGTQHITQALETIETYVPPGEPKPDFKGVIGGTIDGTEGIDIPLPAFNFSETHYMATAAVTPAYKLTLRGLTGKVNDAAFRDNAAGEVRFVGASGSERSAEDWEITFHFEASENVVGLTIGDIVGINKKGWEYVDVHYTHAVDPAAHVIIQKPWAAVVLKVCETASFSGLGIGA